MDNPLQFLILTPFGVGEWKTTPVYDSTAEFPLVFPTGPVGGASVNLGFKLVSGASRMVSSLAEPSTGPDTDGFWHPSEDGGRKFWRLWWEGREARKPSSPPATPSLRGDLPDPFAPTLPSAPTQPFGGKRTVDIEPPGFLWGESDIGPDVPAPPAPPLISVLEPTPDPAYDIQIHWQPFEDPAMEVSLKLRVGDEMPEIKLDKGKFLVLRVITKAGFDKARELKGSDSFAEAGLPFVILSHERIASFVETWRNPPAPPKPVLTWEDGRETLRTLVVSSYRVLTETQQVQIAQLLEDFKHFSAVRERYPNLAYFMVINTMQRALDAVLGLD